MKITFKQMAIFVSILCVAVASAMQPDTTVKFRRNGTSIAAEIATMKPQSTISNIDTVVESTLREFAADEKPQIVIWYGGKNGLAARSRDFYRDTLLAQLMRDDRPFTVIEYDLAAWQGLVQPGLDLTTTRAPFVGTDLQPCGPGQIATLSSCNFFRFLQELDLPEMAFERKAWLTCARNFICSGTVFTELRGTTTFNEIGYQPTIVKELAITHPEMARTQAAYASLQYLEALWLVRTLVMRKIAADTRMPLAVVFLLPNGELEYYPELLFQCDVQLVLNAALTSEPTETRCPVNIIFADFAYCYKARRDTCPRPYLKMVYDKFA